MWRQTAFKEAAAAVSVTSVEDDFPSLHRNFFGSVVCVPRERGCGWFHVLSNRWRRIFGFTEGKRIPQEESHSLRSLLVFSSPAQRTKPSLLHGFSTIVQSPVSTGRPFRVVDFVPQERGDSVCLLTQRLVVLCLRDSRPSQRSEEYCHHDFAPLLSPSHRGPRITIPCPSPFSCFQFASIYKGWLPTVLKVSSAQATRFGVFQVLKSSSFYGKDSTAKSAAAGAAAGATSVFLFQVRRFLRLFSSCTFFGVFCCLLCD